MNRIFLDGRYKTIELFHAPMAFSTAISDVGGFRFGKILHLLLVIWKILHARLCEKTTILYFPPAGPNLVPFLRDCAILICTRWMFKKTVFHFHANGLSDFYRTLPFLLKILYRAAYSHPDLSICITRLGTPDAIAMESNKIEVVPNGLPDEAPEFERGPKGGDPVKILFLSTISNAKGAGILIDALEILNNRRVRFESIFAGPFSSAIEEQILKDKSRELENRRQIRWLGEVSGDKKKSVFMESDLFCFPTHYSSETFGLVLVEAMMFSLPVVSTLWRGIPEVVVDGETGYLVPVKNAEALALKLEALIKNPDLRASMGRAGRQRFKQNFTLQKFQDRMEKALSAVACASTHRTE